MTRWTFYTAPATCALATHIALHEAGATFDTVRLDFKAQEQRGAAYLAINPKGRVPALATERGVITETPALLVFVAQSFPAAQLAPLTDAFAMAQLNELHSYLASTVHVAHAHKHRGSRWADDPAAHDAMRAKVPQTMAACAQLLEDRLTGTWALGDTYSVADAYLFTVASWLEGDGVDTQAFPRLLAHRARMQGRAAVQRAGAEAAG